MSGWNPENGAKARDKLFCVNCGAPLYFKEWINVPELVKCSGCQAQFCLIDRGKKSKPEATQPK